MEYHQKLLPKPQSSLLYVKSRRGKASLADQVGCNKDLGETFYHILTMDTLSYGMSHFAITHLFESLFLYDPYICRWR